MTNENEQYILCTTDRLTNGESLGIREAGMDILLVRWKENWYAYENRCPHNNRRLEWLEHQFFSPGKDFLQCSNHGALFLPNTGRCIAGPCNGESLRSLPLQVDDKQVYLITEPQ